MQAYFYATVAHSLSGQQMTISTNRESDRFMLRLPEGMRDRIKLAADENNRSMNAEIVAALETFYPAPVDVEAIVGKLTPEQRVKLTKLLNRMGEDE